MYAQCQHCKYCYSYFLRISLKYTKLNCNRELCQFEGDTGGLDLLVLRSPKGQSWYLFQAAKGTSVTSQQLAVSCVNCLKTPAEGARGYQLMSLNKDCSRAQPWQALWLGMALFSIVRYETFVIHYNNCLHLETMFHMKHNTLMSSKSCLHSSVHNSCPTWFLPPL